MISRLTFLFSVFLIHVSTSAQDYVNYFTGRTDDLVTAPQGGLCLMGGATEDDNAMRWFLERANGGDVLVLRASGSDGYNDYLYSELGVSVNSVETIVFDNANASNDSYIHQRIQMAEAIWFAGGDQWNYVSFWRDSPIDSLINDGIQNRNIVIGGTSAGMAIQGGFYFSAENGTVTSETALTNPYDENITVDNKPFINNDFMADVVTDTHYDDPDRKGRHIVFLSRMLVDHGIAAKGIACDEYTAVCIDTDGKARVFGAYPDYDDNAYFIQVNCELTDPLPEHSMDEDALHWYRDMAAVKVYAVKGTETGDHYLDLNDWKTGSGGEWQHWYVDEGELNETSGTKPQCGTVSNTKIESYHTFEVFPNPAHDFVTIRFEESDIQNTKVVISNTLGQIRSVDMKINGQEIILNTSNLIKGAYLIEAVYRHNKSSRLLLIE